MANRPKRTAKKDAQFLIALMNGASVTAAAETIHIGRTTVYEWRDEDQLFARAWDQAVDAGTDKLEDEARRRAHDGTSKPVYQGGELVGHVQEYSDTLLIFLLKARRPDKFREQVKHEVSGKITLEHLVTASQKTETGE